MTDSREKDPFSTLRTTGPNDACWYLTSLALMQKLDADIGKPTPETEAIIGYIQSGLKGQMPEALKDILVGLGEDKEDITHIRPNNAEDFLFRLLQSFSVNISRSKSTQKHGIPKTPAKFNSVHMLSMRLYAKDKDMTALIKEKILKMPLKEGFVCPGGLVTFQYYTSGGDCKRHTFIFTYNAGQPPHLYDCNHIPVNVLVHYKTYEATDTITFVFVQQNTKRRHERSRSFVGNFDKVLQTDHGCKATLALTDLKSFITKTFDRDHRHFALIKNPMRSVDRLPTPKPTPDAKPTKPDSSGRKKAYTFSLTRIEYPCLRRFDPGNVKVNAARIPLRPDVIQTQEPTTQLGLSYDDFLKLHSGLKAIDYVEEESTLLFSGPAKEEIKLHVSTIDGTIENSYDMTMIVRSASSNFIEELKGSTTVVIQLFKDVKPEGSFDVGSDYELAGRLASEGFDVPNEFKWLNQTISKFKNALKSTDSDPFLSWAQTQVAIEARCVAVANQEYSKLGLSSDVSDFPRIAHGLYINFDNTFRREDTGSELPGGEYDRSVFAEHILKDAFIVSFSPTTRTITDDPICYVVLSQDDYDRGISDKKKYTYNVPKSLYENSGNLTFLCLREGDSK